VINSGLIGISLNGVAVENVTIANNIIIDSATEGIGIGGGEKGSYNEIYLLGNVIENSGLNAIRIFNPNPEEFGFFIIEGNICLNSGIKKEYDKHWDLRLTGPFVSERIFFSDNKCENVNVPKILNKQNNDNNTIEVNSNRNSKFIWIDKIEYFKPKDKEILISGNIHELKSPDIFIELIKPNDDIEELKIPITRKGKYETIIILDDQMKDGIYGLILRHADKKMGETYFRVHDINDVVENNIYSNKPLTFWTKNKIELWRDGLIDDMYLQKIIVETFKDKFLNEGETYSKSSFPTWFKNNISWWEQSLISDEDFVNGIKYLAEQGIIKV